MRYVQTFLDLLSKKYYDFNRADITLSNFHPQIYVTLASQGIFFGKRDSYLRFVIPVCSIAVTVVGVVLLGLTVYMGVTRTDFSIACESFCYILMICSLFPIYYGILSNKDEIFKLVEMMEHDFKQLCSLGPRYREPFTAGQLLAWKFYILWTSFMYMNTGLFIAFPTVVLLYQNTVATQDEHTTRPLLFPIWLPHDDAYRTPNYEMLFATESFYILAFNVCFSGYVYTQFHFLLHNYIIMDMIILDFQVIFDGLDESVAMLPAKNPRRVAVQLALNKRVGRIVTWHLSVYRAIKTVSTIYRPPLIYQLRCSSGIICLIAYQLVVKFDKGEFDLMFTMIGIAAVVQVWIPCYLGTVLRNKGFEVGEACWGCGWNETKLGSMIRTDLTMILLRAQVPIFIKYTGQPVVQLETFSATMSTAYTYFTMLMQATKGSK